RRANEGNTGGLAGPGECGALAEKAVAGVDGIAAMLPGQRDQLGDVQVSRRAAARQGHGGVGPVAVQGLGIILGIDRQAGDIQLGGGPGQAAGDFATVGNQQTFEGHQIQSLSSFFFTLPVGVIGSDSTTRTSGTLYPDMACRHHAVSCSASSPLPGLAITKATGTSPRCAS